MNEASKSQKSRPTYGPTWGRLLLSRYRAFARSARLVIHLALMWSMQQGSFSLTHHAVYTVRPVRAPARHHVTLHAQGDGAKIQIRVPRYPCTDSFGFTARQCRRSWSTQSWI